MVTANFSKPGLASRSASAVRFICMPSLLSWPRRRAVLQKAAAAATAAVPLAASAKAGQFGKQEFFSIVGKPGISSPSAGGTVHGVLELSAGVLDLGFHRLYSP